MNDIYTFKTAGRRLAELTGHPYQRCLDAVRAGNLDRLIPCPAAADPRDVLGVAAAALSTGGMYQTVHQAQVALLESTIATIVRAHFTDAVRATVEMDEQDPVVGWLAGVDFADGTDLAGSMGEPVADAAFVWADLLAHELGLDPGTDHTITLA